MASPTSPRLSVRKLWLNAAPGASIPWSPRRTLRSVLHGALAGGVALASVFLVPALILPNWSLGPPAHAVEMAGFAFAFGAVHGATIGLVAGLGWRLFALIIGPVGYAWVPLSAANLRTSVLYLIAGCVTSGWVYYATRRGPQLRCRRGLAIIRTHLDEGVA